MKKVLSALIAIIIISTFSCKRNENEIASPQDGILKEKQNVVPVPQGTPLAASEIDKKINSLMETKKD